ncbi:MAG: type II toxin-antitoxin system HicB family antitoxin, partial [Thermodesulfobacteriota bacterium]
PLHLCTPKNVLTGRSHYNSREEYMKYMVVIEKGESSYGAHVPDLPGCIAVGKSREEALRLIKEAIELHIEALQEAGQKVPPPSSVGEYVEIQAA